MESIVNDLNSLNLSKVEDFLYFGSGTKIRELSNFYQCDIEFRGDIYGSSEHIFQSLKFIERDRKRFCKSGDLGGLKSILKFGEIFYGKIDKDGLLKKISYWEKKGCVGIVAKMCTNPKNVKKLGLTYESNVKSDAEVINSFREILTLKFNIEKFKKILSETGNKTLIEFSRSAKRNAERGVIEKWCGLYENGKLYGRNLMGELIMEIRSKLK